MSGRAAGRGVGQESPPRFGLVRMRPRDVREGERGVSNLELLFDLVFAAAVGISSAAMHELAAHGDILGGVGGGGEFEIVEP